MIRTRLRPVSKKRAKADREYKPIHDAVIERDGGCLAGMLRDATVPDALWVLWPEAQCYGQLVVHHVVSRARAPELALNPSNLATLCVTHHALVHANVALATERGLLASVPPELSTYKENP